MNKTASQNQGGQDYDYRKLLCPQLNEGMIKDFESQGRTLFEIDVPIPESIISDSDSKRYLAFRDTSAKIIKDARRTLKLGDDELMGEVRTVDTVSDDVVFSIKAGGVNEKLTPKQKYGITQAALTLVGHLKLHQPNLPQTKDLK